MPFFVVHLDELSQLRSQLQSCAEDMRSIADQLQGPSAGQLGTPGLDQTSADFESTWGYGVGQIAAGSERITEGMRRSCEAYAGAEEALTRMYAQAARAGGVVGFEGGS